MDSIVLMHSFILAAIFLVLVNSVTLRASEEVPLVKKKNLVENVGGSKFKIGLIEFDARTKVVSIPAEIWNTEGLMEYVLVHDNGKIHESILTTKASPEHVQLALKLLKFNADHGEIFERLRGSSDRTVNVEKTKDPGAAFAVQVNWLDEGKSKSASICDFIINTETNKPVKDYLWHYTGSVIYEGTFLAQVEGSIVGLYLDPSALFNTNGPGAEFDERWAANKAALPKAKTKVMVNLIPKTATHKAAALKAEQQ